MRVAIVHELLIKLGGAERVLEVLTAMFPDAPIYTLLYDKNRCGEIFPHNKVITSSLQKWYDLKIPLSVLRTGMPRAIESFDFSQFDLVISSSSAFAHGIITGTQTKHLCYCHSPARFLWDWHFEVIREQSQRGMLGELNRFLIPYFTHHLRIWDRLVADRPDKIIANSLTVQRRILKYWHQESSLIYPPVDVERFELSENHENYFLIVSALAPFKKVEIAVQAFNRIPKHKLIIIGEGDELDRLRNMASKNIEFLGRKNDQVVREYMSNARAFIFPGLEDLGIAPIEAMACGKPVIAFNGGGVKETVIAGETGVFFQHMTPESLLDGLAEFFKIEKFFKPKKIRKRAEEFSKQQFIDRFQEEIEILLEN